MDEAALQREAKEGCVLVAGRKVSDSAAHGYLLALEKTRGMRQTGETGPLPQWVVESRAKKDTGIAPQAEGRSFVSRASGLKVQPASPPTAHHIVYVALPPPPLLPLPAATAAAAAAYIARMLPQSVGEHASRQQFLRASPPFSHSLVHGSLLPLRTRTYLQVHCRHFTLKGWHYNHQQKWVETYPKACSAEPPPPQRHVFVFHGLAEHSNKYSCVP